MDKQDERNWREVSIAGMEKVENSPFITNLVASSRFT
jgi:hypothetical protein